MSGSIRSRRGVTLIEALITVVIGAIAMFALVPPFLAEGNLFRTGKRQTEAQRDAQMALRAMARVARESAGYNASVPGAVTFLIAPTCGGNPVTFELHAGGELHQHCGANTTILIDGARSRVANFTATSISTRLVQIQLQVTHRLRASNPTTRSETLVTDLYLRNAT